MIAFAFCISCLRNEDLLNFQAMNECSIIRTFAFITGISDEKTNPSNCPSPSPPPRAAPHSRAARRAGHPGTYRKERTDRRRRRGCVVGFCFCLCIPVTKSAPVAVALLFNKLQWFL